MYNNHTSGKKQQFSKYTKRRSYKSWFSFFFLSFVCVFQEGRGVGWGVCVCITRRYKAPSFCFSSVALLSWP